VCQNSYDDDELEECVNATEQDLDNPAMPLYYRMRYELLLAGSREGLCEWWEAEDALTRCEAIFHSTSTNHKDDIDENIQKSLQELRELLDSVRAHHAVQPHTLEDPRNTYEDDVDMMDEGEGGEGEEGEEGEAADEQADEHADEQANDKVDEANKGAEHEASEGATVKMEEIVADDNSVKRTRLSETGEIEDMKLVVEPEPSSDSKSGVRLPRISADRPRLPEFNFEEHAKKSNLIEQSEPEPELSFDKQAEQTESTTPPSRWKRFKSSSAKVICKISNAVKKSRGQGWPDH
jgi:hypothetical protein